jgi:PAS domain S-box-containing protein
MVNPPNSINPGKDKSTAVGTEPISEASADVNLPILLEAFDALPDATFLFNEHRLLVGLNEPALILCGPDTTLDFGTTRCCDMFWRVEGAVECIVERAVQNQSTVEVEVVPSPEDERPTLVKVIPLKDGRGNTTGGAIVIARDVTELRRTEAAMLDQKSFLATLVDITPDEIYTLDTSGRITWMNERAEAANLSMPTGVLGRHFSDFVLEDSRELADETIGKTLTGEDAQCEVQITRTDNEVRWVDAHTSPLWKDGRVTGVLVFLRDITDRINEQEKIAQSDKLRAVGELAAGVAHNLNNSLTVIQARAQLLQMKSKDEATIKSLDVITQAVADGSRTLRRILDFARRDSKGQFTRVDLADLVASSVEIAKPKWQGEGTKRPKGITVNVINQGVVPVRAEAAELREVILNLLFNAVDAMPEGGVIETGSRAELDSACFWVADSGMGMSQETLARLFEPFYTTKGTKGTGLGLSASHGIIRRHKGEILVVSEPGEGSRFEVRLPLYEQAGD